MDWLDACRDAAESDNWIEVAYIAREILDRQPNHILALAILGESFMAQHDYKKAEAALKQALAISPAHLDSLVILATLYDRQGRRAEVEQIHDMLLCINPEVARQLHNAYLVHPVPITGRLGSIPISSK
ncbi:MAG TPA: tetratricopeptide repeat protein [Burkholderiales bacterium]|nr:tetratricopeptide repeat protein [Burkholderiales bacterium]